MSSEIHFRGGWEVELAAESAKALEVLAVAIETDAKRYAPVDTGALRDSIRHEMDLSDPESPAAYVGSDEVYAGFVERGTSKMRAQPYLRPALNQTRAL